MAENLSHDKKNFISQLLRYYSKLEEKYEQEMYYTAFEYDSNTTLYETLSNNNMIGLISKLPLKHAKVVLAILKSILSQNFYQFDNEFYDIENLNFNVKKWILTLEENILEDIEESKTLPVGNKMEGFEKFKQKYFKIEEINLNLRITKKKIVKIET